MLRRLLRCLPCLLVLTAVVPVQADEAWERVVEDARRRQDREIEDGLRRKLMVEVVRRYETQARRQPTALNEYLLGRAHLHGGDAAKAEEALRRALQRDPRFWYAHRGLALLALERRDLAAAASHIGALRQRRPGHRDGRRLQAQLWMAEQRFQDALPLLQGLYREDPKDLGALGMMADAHLALRQGAEAVAVVEPLVQQAPGNLGVRQLYARALAGAGRFRQAANQFERIDAALPKKDFGVLLLLRACYLELRDWARLRALLVRMVPMAPTEDLRKTLQHEQAELAKGDPPEPPPAEVREGLRRVHALGDARQFAEAATLLESLLPKAGAAWQYPCLARLEALYVGAQDWARVEHTLKRMQAIAPTPAEKARVTELLGRLEQLKAEGATISLETLERVIVSGALEERRDALRLWLQQRVPMVTPPMLQRLHGQETDPEARVLLVRILASLSSGDWGTVLGRAMPPVALPNLGLVLRSDPSPRVRAAAAAAVGQVPSPAGILYLQPHLLDMDTAALPDAAAERTAFLTEYNTTREALREHVPFRDLPPFHEGGVPAKDLATNQARWKAYFQGAEGLESLREAARAYRDVPEPQPEWMLWPLIAIHRDVALVRNAYASLRHHVEAIRAGTHPNADPKRYLRFPMVDPDTLTAETLPDLRARMQAFIRAIREGR